MSKHYISTMYLKTRSRKQALRTVKKQSGSALIIAVFIIIVISLLGASLVSLQKDSAEGASYDVYAARAYLAAYSASEIALADIFPLKKTPPTLSVCDTTKKTVSLPDVVGFHGCSATIECSSKDIDGKIGKHYTVVSEATCKNSQINTRRQITVEATGLQ